ncbi:MAG: ArgE/DapE family deacylase [bacterium]|nr:ArgE/DapE family deacylase [bacterium]
MRNSIQNKLIELVEKKRDDIIRFVQNLVRIPSVNSPPDGEEKECQEFIASKLKKLDMDVDMFTPDEVPGIKDSPFYVPNRKYVNRPNVIGRIKGLGGGKSLLLTSHVDVVPPGKIKWEHDPWGGDISESKIYGRGAADAKGGLAAQITAVECIKELGINLKGDLLFASVVDEEFGGMNGSLAVSLNLGRIDGVILSEPTSLCVMPGCAGGLQYEIVVKGQFAFEGQKYMGVSAIDKMYKVIKGLQKLENERNRKVKASPLFSEYPIRTPITVISIKGGDFEVGGVPDSCKIMVWHGAIPGEDKIAVMDQLQNILRKVCEKDIWLKENRPDFKVIGTWLDPCEIPYDHLLVKTISSNVKRVTKKDTVIKGMEGSCDLSRFVISGGIAAVVLGPGNIKQAHAVDESIEIEEIMKATKIIALSAIEWCNSQ